MVRTNTINLPGLGAGVVRIKGTDRALAMSVDGNGRYCYLDPYRGAMLAVAEAARNVACAGARPLAATNCLNFGNPERPAIMWQFAKAVEGIGAACRALDVPITGGNVSLYNETDGKAIYPTPVIGVVGLLEHADRVVSRRFQGAGDVIVLLGEGRGELGGSEYLKVVHDLVRGVPPALDLEAERALQALLVDAGRRAAGAVGARLFRRRPGGDARRMLLRHGRHRRRGLDRRRAGRRATRTSTSRRRCSASRRRASSCRSCPSDVTTRAASGRRRRACRRASSARPAATGCGSRSAAQIVIDQSVDEAERVWSTAIERYFAQACGLNNMFDKFKDECGVFGIFGHPEAANMTYLGLYALQHRGQESAGIAASDGEQVRVSRAMGYVADIFDGETLSHAARADGDRPRALLDGRREQAAQRAADPDRLRARPDRDLPQRQPRQRARAARRARAAGLDLPVEQRHRSRPAPLRAVEGAQRRGRDRRVGVAGAGRVLAGDADARIG